MNLRQQLVSHRVENAQMKLSVTSDVAFLRFSHSVITGQSVHAFDDADLVDGTQEKQIDIITIEEDESEATVYVLQGKFTGGFSSNTVIQMGNGLDWLMSTPKATLDTLSNQRLKDRALDVRSVLNRLGPSNLNVIVIYVTNGLTSDLRSEDEVFQEKKRIETRYDNNTLASFSFQLWGADELVARLNMEERRERRIDTDIKILYDTNNPSLLKYHSGGMKGIICTTNASEIARIVNQDNSGAVFDANIRRFLGTRGGVNSDILSTCTSDQSAKEFWFLNNGITIVCDDCDPVTDPDNPHLKIRNLQIVNGCQTATTLALAQRNGTLIPDVRVLLRVYETGGSEIVSRIVLTTNNQNKISSRDLRANDPVQIDMERGFARYGLFYERKPRQYDNNDSAETRLIMANESVAQAYLAVVLRKPSDARRRKYKVWGDLYDSVFCGGAIEPYVFSALLSRQVDRFLKSSPEAHSPDDLRRKLVNNGTFHIARATSHIWQRSDWANHKQLASLINVLLNQPDTITNTLAEALNILEAVIRSDTRFSSDVDNALKSSMLDSELERAVSRLS